MSVGEIVFVNSGGLSKTKPCLVFASNGGMLSVVQTEYSEDGSSAMLKKDTIPSTECEVVGKPPKIGTVVFDPNLDRVLFVNGETNVSNGMVPVSSGSTTWDGLSSSTSNSSTQSPLSALRVVLPTMEGQTVRVSLPDLKDDGKMKEFDLPVRSVDVEGGCVLVQVPHTEQLVRVGLGSVLSLREKVSEAKPITRTFTGGDEGRATGGGGGKAPEDKGTRRGPTRIPFATPLEKDVSEVLSPSEHGVSTPVTLARQGSADPSGYTTTAREEEHATQELQRILTECFEKNEPFVDPEFPPTIASLGEGQETLTFEGGTVTEVDMRRPIELRDEDGAWADTEGLQWSVVKGGEEGVPAFDVEDVQQRALGNCWLIAALAACASHERFARTFRIIKRVRAGVYQLRIVVAGVWVVVTIDSALPCTSRGLLAFTRGRRRQIWPALLEKACAKVAGSYAALVGGRAEEGLRLLTGLPVLHMHPRTGRTTEEDQMWKGILSMRRNSLRKQVRHVREEKEGNVTYIRTSFDMEEQTVEERNQVLPEYAAIGKPSPWGEMEDDSPEDVIQRVWDRVRYWLRRDGIICASAEDDKDDLKRVNLVASHGYSVLGAEVASDGTRLLRCKNPWGRHAFSGPFGPTWDGWLDPSRREDLRRLNPGVSDEIFERAGLGEEADKARKGLLHRTPSSVESWSRGAFLIPIEDFCKYFDGLSVALHRGDDGCNVRRTLTFPKSIDAPYFPALLLSRPPALATKPLTVDVCVSQAHARERQWVARNLVSRVEGVVSALDETGTAPLSFDGDAGGDVGLCMLHCDKSLVERGSGRFSIAADLRRGFHANVSIIDVTLPPDAEGPSKDSSVYFSGEADFLGDSPSSKSDFLGGESSSKTNDHTEGCTLLLPLSFGHCTRGGDMLATVELTSETPLILRRARVPSALAARIIAERCRRFGLREDVLPELGPDGTPGMLIYTLSGDAMEMIYVENRMADGQAVEISFTPADVVRGVVHSRGPLSAGTISDTIPSGYGMITIISSLARSFGAFTWGGARGLAVKTKDTPATHIPPISSTGLHQLQKL